jgi:hypothetical protein
MTSPMPCIEEVKNEKRSLYLFKTANGCYFSRDGSFLYWF